MGRLGVPPRSRSLCGAVARLPRISALMLGTPGALILVYLTQLPLFVAGLWLGVGAAAIAGLSRHRWSCWPASDLLGAAIFAGLNAVPVVLLVRQALLARPAPTERSRGIRRAC